MGDTSCAETVTSGQSVPQTAAAVQTLADAGSTPGQATPASPPPDQPLPLGALLLSFGVPIPPTPVGGATGDDRAVV
jgi:hypothetical protein